MATAIVLAALAALLMGAGGAQLSEAIGSLRSPVLRDPPVDCLLIAIALVCIFLGCALAAAVFGISSPIQLAVD